MSYYEDNGSMQSVRNSLLIHLYKGLSSELAGRLTDHWHEKTYGYLSLARYIQVSLLFYFSR